MAIRSGFTRKLQLAFAAMLLVTLAIAWYFYDSARWFSNDAERLAQAAASLSAHEAVARHTWRAVQDMERAVRLETPMTEEVGAAAEAVRAALVVAAAGVEDDAPGSPERALLDELETVTETLFRSLLVVETALVEGRTTVVEEELARLDRSGSVSRFRGLVDPAIATQRDKLQRLREQAVSLANYVVRLLPGVMVFLVLVTAFVAWRFSTRLSGSLGALHDAARAFALGELEHRVPRLKEHEFQRLGGAFNTMATQLEDKDRLLRESNVKLEAKVEERTRALTESNEKLAQVDEHRRRLLAEISHEFRTPLTVIKGESEIALRGKNLGKDDFKEALRRIVDTADHATALVEDLLFIVRADAGEPRLQVQEVEVTELLRETCEEFGAKAAGKDLEIRYDGDVERATMQGDARRLRQVFAILLDNALRYSHPGGVVEVVTSPLDARLAVEVRDRGIGLSEEEAGQVFERFFRGREAQAHADQGTGLGLPVARAIVEAHGGTIAIAGRKDGPGAVATVILPVEGSLRVVA